MLTLQELVPTPSVKRTVNGIESASDGTATRWNPLYLVVEVWEGVATERETRRARVRWVAVAERKIQESCACR